MREIEEQTKEDADEDLSRPALMKAEYKGIHNSI